MTARCHEVHTVRVLDEDPGLARALDEKSLAVARRYVTASAIELERGRHDPNAIFDGDGLVGLLVLDGLLIRHVRVGDREGGELVGPGAVLRPWDHLGRHAPLPYELSWRVLENTRIARLDRRFLAALIHWPTLVEAIIERTVERAHILAFVVAIHTLRHIDLRLLALFWHLADRIGRVTPDGIQIPLQLSHADLAELIGAARPSVSVALKRLADNRRVWRNQSDRTWLLCHEPPDEVRDIRGYAPGVSV